MHRAGPCHLRPGLDAAAAPARVPGVSSGHAGVSSAAASVLAAFDGDAISFTVTSAGLPGVQRNFTSLAAAVAQVEDARVYARFHFRFSCTDAATLGAQVARYVTGALMQPLR